MKKLVLVVALILPIGTFLFLKFFGKNEFRVEPLFQNGTIPSVAGCPDVVSPYKVPDSVTLRYKDASSLYLLDFSGNPSKQTLLTSKFADFPELKVVKQELAAELCVYRIAPNISFVLVDQYGVIFGHFSDSREELDRLMAEVRIILKK